KTMLNMKSCSINYLGESSSFPIKWKRVIRICKIARDVVNNGSFSVLRPQHFFGDERWNFNAWKESNAIHNDIKVQQLLERSSFCCFFDIPLRNRQLNQVSNFNSSSSDSS